MAYLSGIIGNIKVIAINIFIWIGICIAAYSFVSQPIAAGGLNFGNGSGASFDITRTNGAYSNVIVKLQHH